jgi:methionyl-tRNA synthetase
MVLADVLKRWQVLQGRKSVLLTGTDEHGMKIQRAAAKAGVEPKDFCDKGADVFGKLARQVHLDYDIFIRTTDRMHREGVAYAWQMLEERGYIYESKHEGWYSVSDETFYPQSQVQLVVEPQTGRKIMASIETGREVEWTSERNYHFRLSAFRDKLLQFYQENPEYIVPKSRMQEVIAHVTAGLEDLSISRPAERLQWGVPVPTDPSQTVYVWLDALLNYATAVGYPFTPGKESARGFPPDVQVIGKDIVRFHCIYWPAFLMALDLPLPRQVLIHAHWTMGKRKMSKSDGTGVNPFFALERFGVDPLRWYLIHDGGITDDADYDNAFIIEKYKKFLQGGLGNLASRIIRGKGWDVRRAVLRHAHPDVVPPDVHPSISDDENDARARRHYTRIRDLPRHTAGHMRALFPNRALHIITGHIHNTNVFLQHSSPWTSVTRLDSLAADDDADVIAALEADISRTVYLCAESLRVSAILLLPFVPLAAARLLDMLGVDLARRTWEWCRVGVDDSYGTAGVDVGKGAPQKRNLKGVLFPPLTSDF